MHSSGSQPQTPSRDSSRRGMAHRQALASVSLTERLHLGSILLIEFQLPLHEPYFGNNFQVIEHGLSGRPRIPIADCLGDAAVGSQRSSWSTRLGEGFDPRLMDLVVQALHEFGKQRVLSCPSNSTVEFPVAIGSDSTGEN